MATMQEPQLHFILIPLMAQGHQIPMTDLARLLAERGVIVTIVTTPLNASRFKTIIDRAVDSGFQIQLLQLQFPCEEAGLPQGCENFDNLPSRSFLKNFVMATIMLQNPLEEHLKEIQPPPSCIISDRTFPWSNDIAQKLHIPRIIFYGTSLFYLLCSYNMLKFKLNETVESDSKPFSVPGMPDQIELTKAQISVTSEDLQDFNNRIRETEKIGYGAVVNSFHELEPEYVKEYQKARGFKVWSIGPVSLSNREILDKVERGKKASINEDQCLKWLDSKKPKSVLYACLGSLCRLKTSQVIEIGLGLEASNWPFIWVIRDESLEMEEWLIRERFEGKINGRGLLIRGWAPQVLILSHRAIGGFLTHCGWNSTVEGICAGVPMLTWPMFADQFINEKLIVQVLKIGVNMGVEIASRWGEEEKDEVLVKRDGVKKAVEELMGEGEKEVERRERVRKLSEMAKKAMEEGGSSHFNMTLLIQDIMNQVSQKKKNHPIRRVGTPIQDN